MTKLHIARGKLCIGVLKIAADDEVELFVDKGGDWVELAVGLNSQRFFMTDKDVAPFLRTLIKSVAREDWFNGSKVDSVILLGEDLIALWDEPTPKPLHGSPIVRAYELLLEDVKKSGEKAIIENGEYQVEIVYLEDDVLVSLGWQMWCFHGEHYDGGDFFDTAKEAAVVLANNPFVWG